MDEIITGIRFPIGIVTIVLVTVVMLLASPFEILLAFICLPFAAIFMSRDEIKKSWLGTCPNTIREIPNRVKNIWDWIFAG